MARHRSYSFTLNNPTSIEEDDIKTIPSSYLVFGREKGESNTPHLQGCIVFKNPISFKKIKRYIPRAHIEPTIDLDASIRYCMKDGDIYEKGDRPRQGRRSDFQNVRELLDNGSNIRTIASFCRSYQSIRSAELYLKYNEPRRDFKPHVVWYHGGPGTGKSMWAFQFCKNKDTYIAMSSSKWWDGYDAHTHVIIDDMRRDWTTFHDLLRLLDRYPYTVETKGGTRQFLATHIFITSCYSPQEMFCSVNENIDQLLRRIDHIREFDDEPEPLDAYDTAIEYDITDAYATDEDF